MKVVASFKVPGMEEAAGSKAILLCNLCLNIDIIYYILPFLLGIPNCCRPCFLLFASFSLAKMFCFLLKNVTFLELPRMEGEAPDSKPISLCIHVQTLI